MGKCKITKNESECMIRRKYWVIVSYRVCKLTRVARAARSPVTAFHGPHVVHVLSLPMSSAVRDVSLPRAAGMGPFNPAWVKFLNEEHGATSSVVRSATTPDPKNGGLKYAIFEFF